MRATDIFPIMGFVIFGVFLSLSFMALGLGQGLSLTLSTVAVFVLTFIWARPKRVT